MKDKMLRRALTCAVCLALLGGGAPAKADLKSTGDEIGIGIVATAAAVTGLVIFLVVHYHRDSVKGCVATGQSGLEIRSDSDQMTYQLAGDSSAVKAGDVVKVKGKKHAAKGTAPATFTVNSVSQDFGSCPASAITHP